MPFPINTILSTFEGSESPISEGSLWSTDSRMEGTAAAKVAGVLTGSSAGEYWNATYATTFGPQCENYITVVNFDGAPILLRIKIHEGSTGFNDYNVFISSPDWGLYKNLDSSSALLTAGAIATQSVASGDSVGIAYDSGNVIAYHKPAAGSWTALITQADASYQNVSGKLAIDSQGITQTYDNFGGGTINAVQGAIGVSFTDPLNRYVERKP